MANWACTDYVIEGPKETLKRIYEAIQHPIVDPNSDKGWEGNVLNTLGIKWENQLKDGSGYYMGGFIRDVEDIGFNPETDSVLSFYAEEAWGATDFNEVLEEAFPDIKVYFSVIEEGGEVYATNDKDGNYFPCRWSLEARINGNYEYGDFEDSNSLFKCLSEITKGKVKDFEDVEKFNSKHEDVATDDENYINIHEWSIVD